MAELRRHLDRLTLFEGSIDDAAREHRGEGFDGYKPLRHLRVSRSRDQRRGSTAGSSTPPAPPRAWPTGTMLVPRRLAATQPGRVRSLDAEARELFARDRAFFYNAFVLEEVA